MQLTPGGRWLRAKRLCCADSCHRQLNGNTLHNYGSGARTREIAADGTLVWDIKWSGGDSEGSGRLQGRSVFLEDLYDFAP